MTIDLVHFWAFAVAFAILVYVVLDGFDLGVGLLFGTTRNEAHRRTMMNAIAPVWDGNETWLILIGTCLYGAFPMVYAIFLSAFYLPVGLLLIGLILRGVAFEFRYKSRRFRWLWDLGFFLGSVIAAFVQGAAVGAMALELAIVDGQYAGGPFSWLTPFAVICGLGLVCGYGLLGACWLVLKTEGEVRDWAYKRVTWFLLGTVGFAAITLLYVLVVHLRVLDRWTGTLWLWIFPLIAAAAAVGVYHGVQRRKDWQPFAMTVVIFLAAFAALAGSYWPYMIPYSVTVSEAASPHASLSFMFYGAGLFALPVILIYTVTVYWIFRGKVGVETRYE